MPYQTPALCSVYLHLLCPHFLRLRRRHAVPAARPLDARVVGATVGRYKGKDTRELCARRLQRFERLLHLVGRRVVEDVAPDKEEPLPGGVHHRCARCTGTRDLVPRRQGGQRRRGRARRGRRGTGQAVVADEDVLVAVAVKDEGLFDEFGFEATKLANERSEERKGQRASKARK